MKVKRSVNETGMKIALLFFCFICFVSYGSQDKQPGKQKIQKKILRLSNSQTSNHQQGALISTEILTEILDEIEAPDLINNVSDHLAQQDQFLGEIFKTICKTKNETTFVRFLKQYTNKHYNLSEFFKKTIPYLELKPVLAPLLLYHLIQEDKEQQKNTTLSANLIKFFTTSTAENCEQYAFISAYDLIMKNSKQLDNIYHNKYQEFKKNMDQSEIRVGQAIKNKKRISQNSGKGKSMLGSTGSSNPKITDIVISNFNTEKIIKEQQPFQYEKNDDHRDMLSKAIQKSAQYIKIAQCNYDDIVSALITLKREDVELDLEGLVKNLEGYEQAHNVVLLKSFDVTPFKKFKKGNLGESAIKKLVTLGILCEQKNDLIKIETQTEVFSVEAMCSHLNVDEADKNAFSILVNLLKETCKNLVPDNIYASYKQKECNLALFLEEIRNNHSRRKILSEKELQKEIKLILAPILLYEFLTPKVYQNLCHGDIIYLSNLYENTEINIDSLYQKMYQTFFQDYQVKIPILKCRYKISIQNTTKEVSAHHEKNIKFLEKIIEFKLTDCLIKFSWIDLNNNIQRSFVLGYLKSFAKFSSKKEFFYNLFIKYKDIIFETELSIKEFIDQIFYFFREFGNKTDLELTTVQKQQLSSFISEKNYQELNSYIDEGLNFCKEKNLRFSDQNVTFSSEQKNSEKTNKDISITNDNDLNEELPTLSPEIIYELIGEINFDEECQNQNYIDVYIRNNGEQLKDDPLFKKICLKYQLKRYNQTGSENDFLRLATAIQDYIPSCSDMPNDFMLDDDIYNNLCDIFNLAQISSTYIDIRRAAIKSLKNQYMYECMLYLQGQKNDYGNVEDLDILYCALELCKDLGGQLDARRIYEIYHQISKNNYFVFEPRLNLENCIFDTNFTAQEKNMLENAGIIQEGIQIDNNIIIPGQVIMKPWYKNKYTALGFFAFIFFIYHYQNRIQNYLRAYRIT